MKDLWIYHAILKQQKQWRVSWREDVVAVGKFQSAAYFGHSYLVTGAFGVGSSESGFLDVEHR